MSDASGARVANFVWQVLLDLRDYLKNPQLLTPQYHWDRRIWGVLAVLVAVDAVLTIPIIWLLLGYEDFITSVLSLDAPVYAAMEDESFAEALLLAVVAAPLIEEPLFRGWLTGRLRHALFGFTWVGWFAVASALLLFGEDETIDAVIGITLLVAILLSVMIHFIGDRDQQPSPVLMRYFPWLFWIGVISFALVHVTNYDYDNYLLVVPYVIPQLVAGILWGYARIAYGLRASILLHAVSNFWITCLYFVSEQGLI
jgi:membrane protease YdiL (CAAX protease family)